MTIGIFFVSASAIRYFCLDYFLVISSITLSAKDISGDNIIQKGGLWVKNHVVLAKILDSFSNDVDSKSTEVCILSFFFFLQN